MLELTSEKVIAHENSDRCCICKGEFTTSDYKAKDHDHMQGYYRGAPHNSCNLKARVPHFLPIIMHSLSGYDSHLFIRELGEDEKTIDVIPENSEKYISFSKRVKKRFSLRFLDSCRFMPSSLEKLASNLHESEFKNVQKYFSNEEASLLLRKGVYPYDYMDNFEKFCETDLPPKDKFYSRLNEQNIIDADYEHAQNVWRKFCIKNMGEYTDL
ncbi:hypothetical protein AVEN_181048-1 [Araneus ventricosus]|uniref:DNA-directed DNA polymerase n=1 Tax=Araneus ventricosus TaxID=182803 RepID=A0A4Y2KN45_ARAVE|nr:hypothetical protein AVEN_181048-1 [Araneus ventricosus]